MLHRFKKRPVIKSDWEKELDACIKFEQKEPIKGVVIGMAGIFLIPAIANGLDLYPNHIIDAIWFISWGFAAGSLYGEIYVEKSKALQHRKDLMWQKYNEKKDRQNKL